MHQGPTPANADFCPSPRQMSELQRHEEQLERRAEGLRKTEDTSLRTQDQLDHITTVRQAQKQARFSGDSELRLHAGLCRPQRSSGRREMS